MDNVMNIPIIVAIVFIVIGFIYQMFHMKDFVDGLSDIENFKRCQDSPVYKKAFLEYHDNLLRQGKLPIRKISKVKIYWMNFREKMNL